MSYRNICSMKKCGKVRRKKWGKCGQPSNYIKVKKNKKKKRKPKPSYNHRTTSKKPPSYVKLPECDEKCKKYRILIKSYLKFLLICLFEGMTGTNGMCVGRITRITKTNAG